MLALLPLVTLPVLGPLLLSMTDPKAAPQPATADPATVAVQQIDDRMTVPVQIGKAGPYRFVIDTGAERTVIARELATTLGLADGPSVRLTAMSGTSTVGTVMIPSLQVSALPEPRSIAAPALLAQHLGAHGLLGLDALRDHRVVIDFQTATMTVRPSKRRPRREVPIREGEIVVRARSLLGQLIVTDAEFDGHPVRVVIDTGAAISVGNSALRRLVTRASGPLEPLEVTSVTGEAIKTRYAYVDRMRVGRVEFGSMPIAFADVPPFRRFGLERRPALLLGMSTLKSFRQIEVDFPNREVSFQMPRKTAGL